MEWNMMEPVGAAYALGHIVDDVYIPSDDCEEVLEEMIDALLNEDQRTFDVRRRMSLELVVEKDLVPLLKVCHDEEIFGKAVRLMAKLTQPFHMCIQPTALINETYSNEVNNLISTAKHQGTDLDFLKSLSTNMKAILDKEILDPEDCECLNYCVLLLRNLFHIKPGTSPDDQASIAHQCLISSFFINELDKVIYRMLNHKHKETWTIGMAQLISFLFKDYSASLLEPDIDDSASVTSSDESQDIVEILCTGKSSDPECTSLDKHLSTNFKSTLHIRSGSENSLDDEHFMLGFKSTLDDHLEVKLTNCFKKNKSAGAGAGEDMDFGDGCNKGLPTSCNIVSSSQDFKGSNTSLNSDRSFDEGEIYTRAKQEKDVLSSINTSSCLMDTDILISYLKKFATDIMYSGFVDLVENIMKALLTKYDSILDHSFLMWTVGFFLSFAHQQELDFVQFKEVLNLDLFGFLVYEGVKCCESLEVKHQKKQDCSVERHRLHLVVCTLNQLFRTLLANSKMAYLQNLQKCLSHMTDLHNLFIMLIRHHIVEEQQVVYLRDLVQTNHVLMLMIEEWLSQDYIGHHSGFSMLNHVKQFATKKVMAKYGSLLEHQDPSRETLNVAVLTMMYHVAGDCRRQDTLMQLPILKSFSEIWADSAVREHEEFKDLIEFVLEVFMSAAENDPNLCAENLLGDAPQHQENQQSRSCSGSTSGSGSRDESSMNVSSSCSGDELTEEEQILLFTWLSELDGSSNIVELMITKLKEHGYSRSPSQVSSYLSENGFIESNASPSLQSSTENTAQQLSTSCQDSLRHELSSLSEDSLIPFLLDKLRNLGFEGQLVWLQKQLLEAAFVKLAIKDPSYRVNVEEPVAKFYALQNKPIPMVAWNDELADTLSNPYFHLLQQCLGLHTRDDTNIIYPRIPQDMSPSLLVKKARQIGSIESLNVKFDVETLKDPLQEAHPKNIDICKPIKILDHLWLNLIQKMNEDSEISGS